MKKCTFFWECEKNGLSLGLTHLVYWTRSDGDTCLKVDTYYHFNGSVLLDTGLKSDPKKYHEIS